LCATGWVYWNWFDTYHFVVVEEGKLYRDGNRGLREFANAIRRARPRVVVSIVGDEEIGAQEFKDEEAFLAQRGISYVRIPIVKGEEPTTEQVRQFLAIATDPSKQPVLVHCNEGIRRAGMMMAAYQESVMGFDDSRAEAAIQSFGHSERTTDEVREFISRYDCRSREVRAAEPTGQPAATEPAGQ
jgi:protein tyrosine phosphatase (PTP) superfamily phosphohydrolase (DUF442 family)